MHLNESTTIANGAIAIMTTTTIEQLWCLNNVNLFVFCSITTTLLYVISSYITIICVSFVRSQLWWAFALSGLLLFWQGSVTMPIKSSYKYMCITTNEPHINSNPNHNPNPTTKQHAIVNIQLNMVTCPTYAEKFVRDNVVAPFVLLSIVIVTLPF